MFRGFAFFSLFFMALSLHAYEQTLQCKVDSNGYVKLTYYVSAPEGVQQMVYDVGQETWQEPNKYRPICQMMKEKYIVYKGEKLGAPYCICTGSFRNVTSVFASVKGEEIELHADNWFMSFKGLIRYPSFQIPDNYNGPECAEACWP